VESIIVGTARTWWKVTESATIAEIYPDVLRECSARGLARPFSAEAENFLPDAVGEQSHSIGTVREPMPMGAYSILIKQVNPDSQFLAECQ
jgi:hypothetical protein